MGRENRRRYYGQNGEDYLIWRFFADKPGGFFLDIGAFDGVFLSNTKSFEEQGWRGICVEAHPLQHARCRENRPGSQCIQAACVGDDRRSVLLRADPSGIYSGIAADERFIAAVYRHHGVRFDGMTSIEVPARRLDEILGDLREPIDFVSLDVEGSELDVLVGFDLARFGPTLLVIEANNAAEITTLDAYMAGRAYSRGRSIHQNHFYVRSEAEAHRLQRIEIDCEIEPVTHPDGYTAVGHAARRVWRGPEPRNELERQILRLRKHWRRWRQGR